VPDRFGGDVMSDLNGKRGRVLGMTPQGDGYTMIEATAPLRRQVLRELDEMRKAYVEAPSVGLGAEIDRHERLAVSMRRRPPAGWFVQLAAKPRRAFRPSA